MALSVAVQMDPIERINIRGDSTFAMLLEARKRGYELQYLELRDLYLRDGRTHGRVSPERVDSLIAAARGRA